METGQSSGGPTILLDVFLTNQHRKRMIEAALAQTDLPAADYPLYVLVGHGFVEAAHALGMSWDTAASAWSGTGASCGGRSRFWSALPGARAGRDSFGRCRAS